MYAPDPLPSDVKDTALALYIQREFQRLSGLLSEIKILNFAGLNVAPGKPREGMVAFADGGGWNPGGTGAGLYQFKGGTWTKL